MGNRGATRALLACGVAGPPLFVGVFLIDRATRAGYGPWRHWIRDLSLGERGWLGAVNLVFFGLLMLGFSFGLRRVLPAEKGPIWGPRLIAIDPSLGYPPGTPPQNPVSWHGQVHDLAGILVFGSMMAVCFALARRLAGDPNWRSWTSPSIFAGAAVGVSLVAGSAWLSLLAIRLLREKEPLEPPASYR